MINGVVCKLNWEPDLKNPYKLTKSELDVLGLVHLNGRSPKQAADALFVTRKTVEAHINGIYNKTNLRDRGLVTRSLFNQHLESITITVDNKKRLLEKRQRFDDSLSKTEACILESVLEGRAAKEIADFHYISPKTVNCHIANIKKKAGKHLIDTEINSLDQVALACYISNAVHASKKPDMQPVETGLNKILGCAVDVKKGHILLGKVFTEKQVDVLNAHILKAPLPKTSQAQHRTSQRGALIAKKNILKEINADDEIAAISELFNQESHKINIHIQNGADISALSSRVNGFYGELEQKQKNALSILLTGKNLACIDRNSAIDLSHTIAKSLSSTLKLDLSVPDTVLLFHALKLNQDRQNRKPEPAF